ncbi:MAG: Ig-like domain-containing protein, partial [Pseudomonadota bacterium]
HPVTTHTKSNQYSQFYEPLLGNGDFDITSFQGGNSRNSMYNLIRDWRGQSMAAGVPWAISFDEPQKIENDADDVSNGYPHGRRDKMWPAYMGGAAGFEWYVQQDGGGHSFDQAIDDFSEMDVALRWAGHAVSFFESLPLQNMVPLNGLADSSSGGNSYVLAAPGLTYAVFNDRNGENWTLDLSDAPGVFEVSWFDPRNGGALQTGTQTGGIAGGQEVNLGSAPYAVNNDWAALVTRVDGGNLSPTVQILAPASNTQFDAPAAVQVTVQAADNDGTVERVALRVNDVSQGDVTNPPFEWMLFNLAVGIYDLVAEAEDNDGAITQSPTTTIVVTEPGAGPQVVGATLVNAASNTDIMDLSDGARIALTDAPAFNVRAEVSPEVTSVDFSLTGVESRTHTENVAPFTLWGDNGGDYNEWIPSLGVHTLTLTPRDAAGAAGSNMVIEFQVEADAVAEGVFANGFEVD